MDEQRQRIEELHRRRRDIVAQELKAYLAPPQGSGLWAAIGGQPAASPGAHPRLAKVLRLPRRDGA